MDTATINSFFDELEKISIAGAPQAGPGRLFTKGPQGQLTPMGRVPGVKFEWAPGVDPTKVNPVLRQIIRQRYGA